MSGLSPCDERGARQKLLAQAVEAKINLGTCNSTYFGVGDVMPGRNIDTDISRAEFEASIQHYVDKIGSIMDALWITAGIRPDQVDRAIRVGGSSRIPCMRALLNDQVGKSKVWGDIKESLCVAEGAAMYAAFLDDSEVFGREIQITTRTCHALGIEVADGKFHAMILGNRQTPCQHQQSFTNTGDNVTSLDFNIYQGSARLAKDNSLIGTVSVSDLPKKPKGSLDIAVTFKVSEEQMLSIIVEIDGRRKVENLKFA